MLDVFDREDGTRRTLLSIVSWRKTRASAGTSIGSAASTTCSSTRASICLSAAFEREVGAKTVSFHLGLISRHDRPRQGAVCRSDFESGRHGEQGAVGRPRDLREVRHGKRGGEIAAAKRSGAIGRPSHYRDQGLRSLRVRRHARAADGSASASSPSPDSNASRAACASSSFVVIAHCRPIAG